MQELILLLAGWLAGMTDLLHETGAAASCQGGFIHATVSHLAYTTQRSKLLRGLLENGKKILENTRHI